MFQLAQIDMQYDSLAAKLSAIAAKQLLWQTSGDTGLWDLRALLSPADAQVMQCRCCDATVAELANLVTLDPATGLSRAVFWREYDAGGDVELRRALDILAGVVERNPIVGLPRRWVNSKRSKPTIVGCTDHRKYPHYWADIRWNTETLVPDFGRLYSKLVQLFMDIPPNTVITELLRIVEFCTATDLDTVTQPRHVLALLQDLRRFSDQGNTMKHALALTYSVVTGDHTGTWRLRQLRLLEEFFDSALHQCIVGLVTATNDDERLELILNQYIRIHSPMSWDAIQALDSITTDVD